MTLSCGESWHADFPLIDDVDGDAAWVSEVDLAGADAFLTYDD